MTTNPSRGQLPEIAARITNKAQAVVRAERVAQMRSKGRRLTTSAIERWLDKSGKTRLKRLLEEAVHVVQHPPGDAIETLRRIEDFIEWRLELALNPKRGRPRKPKTSGGMLSLQLPHGPSDLALIRRAYGVKLKRFVVMRACDRGITFDEALDMLARDPDKAPSETPTQYLDRKISDRAVAAHRAIQEVSPGSPASIARRIGRARQRERWQLPVSARRLVRTR